MCYFMSDFSRLLFLNSGNITFLVKMDEELDKKQDCCYILLKVIQAKLTCEEIMTCSMIERNKNQIIEEFKSL